MARIPALGLQGLAVSVHRSEPFLPVPALDPEEPRSAGQVISALELVLPLEPPLRVARDGELRAEA